MTLTFEIRTIRSYEDCDKKRIIFQCFIKGVPGSEVVDVEFSFDARNAPNWKVGQQLHFDMRNEG